MRSRGFEDGGRSSCGFPTERRTRASTDPSTLAGNVGFYDVTFNRAVNACLPLATVGSDTLFYIPRPVSLTVNASTVRVRVINVDGAANDAGVYLAVFC